MFVAISKVYIHLIPNFTSYSNTVLHFLYFIKFQKEELIILVALFLLITII